MTLGYRTEDFEKTRLLHMRNATIPIGCACVMDTTLVRLEALIQHFVEKRGKTTTKEFSRIEGMLRLGSIRLARVDRECCEAVSMGSKHYQVSGEE